MVITIKLTELITPILAITGMSAGLLAAWRLSAMATHEWVERAAWTPLFLAAQIVLIALLSSAIDAFSGAALALGHVLVLAAVIAIRFRFSHRRRELARDQAASKRGGEAESAISPTSRRRNGVIGVTSALICVIVLALSLFVAIRTHAPTNFDSQTYRLPRVAFWLDASSIAKLNTNNVRMNLMPYNDALLVGWTYALLDDDRLVNLSSWLFGGGLLVLAHQLARAGGLSRRFAPLAPAVLCGAPMFAVQMGGVQSDIFAAYFVAAATLGSVRWLRSGERRWLWLSAAALGLGVGTKQTVILALPALALIFLPLLRQQPIHIMLRRWVGLAGAFSLGVAVLGSWSYVNNFRWYGHPLGEQATRVSEGVKDRSFHGFRWRLKRELFIHFSPMPAPTWAVPPLSVIRDVLFVTSATGWWISRAFEYEWVELLNHGAVLNHDVTGFGTVLSLFYCAALATSWPGRRAPPGRWLAPAMLWSGVVLLVTITASIEFMTTNGRFLLIAAPFGAVGITAVTRRIHWSRLRGLVVAMLLATSATGGLLSIAYHIQQPLFGTTDSALATYRREATIEIGDTVGLLPGADGPIWEFMTPRTGRRFVSLSDADYPLGDAGVTKLMRERGLTTLIADAAAQHEGCIPGTLSAYHTWFGHVPGKGMRRIYVSWRLPAAVLVEAGGDLVVSGEMNFEPPNSVRPCQWSNDPMPCKARLEMADEGGGLTFLVRSDQESAAIVETQTGSARRFVVEVTVGTGVARRDFPREDGTAHVAIRLAPGENRIRLALRPAPWPDVDVSTQSARPTVERVGVWPLAPAIAARVRN